MVKAGCKPSTAADTITRIPISRKRAKEPFQVRKVKVHVSEPNWIVLGVSILEISYQTERKTGISTLF